MQQVYPWQKKIIQLVSGNSSYSSGKYENCVLFVCFSQLE